MAQADKKKRNLSTNVLGEERGQLYVQQQDISTLALRKFTKRPKKEEGEKPKESKEADD